MHSLGCHRRPAAWSLSPVPAQGWCWRCPGRPRCGSLGAPSCPQKVPSPSQRSSQPVPAVPMAGRRSGLGSPPVQRGNQALLSQRVSTPDKQGRTIRRARTWGLPAKNQAKEGDRSSVVPGVSVSDLGNVMEAQRVCEVSTKDRHATCSELCLYFCGLQPHRSHSSGSRGRLGDSPELWSGERCTHERTPREGRTRGHHAPPRVPRCENPPRPHTGCKPHHSRPTSL